MQNTISSHTSQVHNDIISLDNNTFIRIGTMFDKGGTAKWTRSSTQLRFFKCIEKTKRPKFAAFNPNNTHHIAIADFDTCNGFADHRSMKAYLKKFYKHLGIVCASVSGKTKLLIPIKIENTDVNEADFVNIVTNYLESLFFNDPMDILDNIDLSYSALTLSFMTIQMAKQMSKELKNYSPVLLEYDKGGMEDSLPNTLVSIGSKPYRMYKGSINNKQLNRLLTNRLEKKLFRVLLATKGLLYGNGFQLSQLKISETLGCSLGMANMLVKRFRSKGWLSCVSHKYVNGIRAKTYIASGMLLIFMRKIYSEITQLSLPNKIDNHAYHVAIWRLSYHWWNKPEEFMAWGRTIIPPGRFFKERFKKIINSIKSREYYSKIVDIK